MWCKSVSEKAKLLVCCNLYFLLALTFGVYTDDSHCFFILHIGNWVTDYGYVYFKYVLSIIMHLHTFHPIQKTV